MKEKELGIRGRFRVDLTRKVWQIFDV